MDLPAVNRVRNSLNLPETLIESLELSLNVGSICTDIVQFTSSTVTTGSIMTLDIFLAVIQQVDAAINDWKDDSEISKIVNALYNPKVLNKLLGQALNFGAEEKKSFVKKVDTIYDIDFSSIPFLSWIDRVWDNTEGSSLPQDHYDFSKILEFWSLPEEVSQQLFLSDEMRLLLNIDLRRNNK